MNPVIVRRVQIGLIVAGTVITVIALVLIAGCFKNDATINESKATVMADVVSADRLHAEVNFQTPDGRFYSPRLGLLYPTELSAGQRIRVDYAAYNPDIARPAGRSATLSIIPGVSIAIIGWLIVGVLMVLVAEFSRRWAKRHDGASSEPAPPDAASSAADDSLDAIGDDDRLIVTEKHEPV